MTIQDGGTLPAIDLIAPDGSPIHLADYIGAPFVLYFYPKDDTPGCTNEAKDFSRLLPDFAAAGAKVLGVSGDTPAKHQKFTAKYDLTVPLASYEGEAALEAFGVWVEKKLYGKTYMGLDRSTFLFNSSGVLVRSWRKVRVPGHAEEVLKTVQALA
ncbi:peroxiredoxin [Sphingomonas sp. MMS24-J45]|uniref:peroxiredoxin n=1 Tax=Sphingomonas sp. MMS24-J45 TaxID=3238806 RepID=UPI00384F9883